jgi:peptidoglycan/LPS O-acetylase OafA/YrhL
VPRISTLDGWRGVAILLVIADHACRDTRFSESMWGSLGSFGVDIFFVLSGYIITARLVQERERTSTITLSSFYWRRAFRILPLVIAYLTVLCVLSVGLGWIDLHCSDVIGSLFFFRNYQLARSVHGIYTGHFWSLSVEEHFYLLWPGLLLWLGNRRGLWAAVCGAVAVALWRAWALSHAASILPGALVLRTDLRLDGLLLGSALALVLAKPTVRRFIFRNFPKEAPLFAGFALLLLLQHTGGLPSLFIYLLISLAVACTLVVEDGLVHKWLNSRPLVWVGTVSYSIYVWQQLFLIHPRWNTLPFGRMSRFPYELLCITAAACCSYFAMERPMIALGKRLWRGSSRACTEASETFPEVAVLEQVG